MVEKTDYQKSDNYLSVLKHHYMAIILLPIYFSFSTNLLIGLQIESKYVLFNSIMFFTLIIEIGLFLWFMFLPVFYLFKGKISTAFYILVTIITVITITSLTLVKRYGIDSDDINYFIYNSEYMNIIEKSPSIATDGGPKLVKIKMKTTLFACDSYFVYDESDQMLNPLAKYRGVNILEITDVNGNKKKYISNNVTAKKYAEHIYIVQVCADIGQ